MGLEKFWVKNWHVKNVFGPKNVKFKKKFGPKRCWVKKVFGPKKFEFKEIWLKTELSFRKIAQRFLIRTNIGKFWVQKDFKTVDKSYRWPNNQVWWKWDWYQLGYSIIFKLGQMFHGQMLTVRMSPVDISYKWPNHPTFKV